jgi:glycerol-3-phosphate cytidylyltransferase
MKYKLHQLGYTTGAFDLFHVGHLRLLKRAAELCDKLIVGVSTSESMEKFKDVGPVISFEQRCEIVNSLPFVHNVIPNEILDHEITRKRLGFDVFIIGDDWQQRLPDISCPVIYLPRTKGISTRSIQFKIQSSIRVEPEFA